MLLVYLHAKHPCGLLVLSMRYVLPFHHPIRQLVRIFAASAGVAHEAINKMESQHVRLYLLLRMFLRRGQRPLTPRRCRGALRSALLSIGFQLRQSHCQLEDFLAHEDALKT